MAKEVKQIVKLQIQAGKATPAPPVGTALGPHGLNIQEFCTKFNDASKDKMGELVPVVITVYKDRTYDFVMKSAPASELIKQAIKIKKGSGKSLTEKAGTITQKQLEEIAEKKMADLNAHDIKAGAKIIAGTAKQMGVEVKN